MQTFLDMYPTLAAEAEASQEPSRKLTRVPRMRRPRRRRWACDRDAGGRTTCSRTSRSRTARSTRWYEIAQTMGTSLGVSDTMALISSKLSNLVPFSCCALFLYSEETETLRCRFATGVESEPIQPLTIRNGHGLTGWVARNRRPLVNARPSTDLEAAGFPPIAPPCTRRSSVRCVFNDRFIGTLSVYHTDRRSITTTIAGCSTASRNRPRR